MMPAGYRRVESDELIQPGSYSAETITSGGEIRWFPCNAIGQVAGDVLSMVVCPVDFTPVKRNKLK